MRIMCAKSGIIFNAEHFPAYLESSTYTHPIFHLPQKKLISFVGKWASASFTKEESYLLYIALLDSTDLLEFRCPASRLGVTDSVVAMNMEHLVRVIASLNFISTPHFKAPRISLNHETASLESSPVWIRLWEDSVTAFRNGYRNEIKEDRLLRRERAITKLILDPNKTHKHYAKSIAEWAAEAGEFSQSVAGRWKEIIFNCAARENFWNYPTEEIQAIYDYCLENIEVGTLMSNALFEILKAALSRQEAYFGYGDLDSEGTPFQIVETSVNSAMLQQAISTAPKQEPQRSEYPTEFDYIRARGKWKLAQASANMPKGDSSDAY